MTLKEKSLKELKLEEKKLQKKLLKVQFLIKEKQIKKKKKKAPKKKQKKDDKVTADIVLRTLKEYEYDLDDPGPQTPRWMTVRNVFEWAEDDIKQHLKGKTPKNTLDALMQRMVKRGDLSRRKQMNSGTGKLQWYYGLSVVKHFLAHIGR